MRTPPNERVSRHSRPARPERVERRGPAASKGLKRAEKDGPHAPERTCILSRKQAHRDDLIRLALGPDGQVAPDVRARAPGRGAWIGVDRAALEAAQAKGKLNAPLARAFKTGAVSVPDDLGARIEAALKQAALDRLGLEARAGTLLTGAEKIETAARRGQVHLLIHAADAGEDGRAKLDQAWRVGEGAVQGLVFPAERPILSLALGRQNVVHIALIDRAAAARVTRALSRWRAFIGPDAGIDGRAAATPERPAMDVNEG